jgi:hypothetical protein
MWLSLVRKTEWSTFLDLVSPSFFDVLPAGVMSRQAKVLLSNSLARERFAHARERCAELLERGQVAVALEEPRPAFAPVSSLPREARAAHGERVLQLFFLQLLGSPEALLDLRAERFRIPAGTAGGTAGGPAGGPSGVCTWWPAPVFVTWEPAFLAALRSMYRGFYGGGPEELKRGLTALGLEVAEDIFQEHFGRETRAVRFDLSHFQRTFHAAFVRCRDAGRQLHGNFLPLGLSLACLYQHLEQLDVPLDVQGAFEAARKGA